ncbi:MAG: hypothetical protein ACLT98_10045 [Eggerthellaceae bacterium]
MVTYTKDLRSISRGSGSYTIEVNGYEEAPHDVQERLVKAYQGNALRATDRKIDARSEAFSFSSDKLHESEGSPCRRASVVQGVGLEEALRLDINAYRGIS